MVLREMLACTVRNADMYACCPFLADLLEAYLIVTEMVTQFAVRHGTKVAAVELPTAVDGRL